MKYSALFILAVVLLILPGCGGDGGSDAVDSPVINDLFFNDSQVGLTDQIDLNAQFSFDGGKVLDARQPVVILIRLSPELEYIEGSGLVYGEDQNRRVVAIKENCPNGDTYLRFPLRSSLQNAASPNGADAELALSVRGKTLGIATAEARAQYIEVIGSCAQGIIPDAVATITVTVRGSDSRLHGADKKLPPGAF